MAIAWTLEQAEMLVSENMGAQMTWESSSEIGYLKGAHVEPSGMVLLDIQDGHDKYHHVSPTEARFFGQEYAPRALAGMKFCGEKYEDQQLYYCCTRPMRHPPTVHTARIFRGVELHRWPVIDSAVSGSEVRLKSELLAATSPDPSAARSAPRADPLPRCEIKEHWMVFRASLDLLEKFGPGPTVSGDRALVALAGRLAREVRQRPLKLPEDDSAKCGVEGHEGLLDAVARFVGGLGPGVGFASERQAVLGSIATLLGKDFERERRAVLRRLVKS
jgi:hypothetical protein